MPSIILAPIKITGADGEIIFGDVLQVNPKSTSKANSGAGGSNTGDFSATFSLVSFTNNFDPDIADSNNAANN
ncbi:spore germination protein [Paenibacillus ehimensis]|uniref:Spore germination protein n=1 Tax=Paenibacillus ehimensis TaxID=79264 RepID=A0ABT8VAT6_9BACL|nr:spore germination protein [Paenibacillus ehimensis]MDO3678078.1 spore germination protein [Paenibacillus ehimensis]MEC0210540.1 spore germination protein [Paenibacillus ehimensis]